MSRGEIKIEKKRYRTRVGKSASLTDQQVLWYEQNDEDIWEYIRGRVDFIKNQQIRRRWELAIFQNLYCNFQNNFGNGVMFGPGAGANWVVSQRMSTNVIKSCVDTATARIAKDKPRVFCMPNSADARIIKKAENQTKFLDGLFAAAGVYSESEDEFRDGGIYGDGALWAKPVAGELKVECVKQDELVIDLTDGRLNKPREIHIDRPVPRQELLAAYPDAAEAIENAKHAWRGDLQFLAQADMVRCIYSWRKRSTPDAKDGKYAVSIEGKTLEVGEWAKDYFPVLRWQWTVPTYGPFGMGIAHELEGRQMAITDIMRSLMRSIHLFAVPRVWLEKMSGVSKNSLTNDEGTANYYTGTAPIFQTPSAAAPDIYQFLQWLISDSYQQIGLSQMTAQSEKPAGLNSGVAMRTYQDVETQRFAIVGQRWERHYVEIGDVLLDMAADLYKDKGSYSVNVPGRGFIEQIDWKDIGLKRDQYDLAAYPTSLLPRTPEGQLQTVQELINSGFMPEDVALSQLRIPNLNAWIDEKTASRDNINMCLSRIRDKKKYTPPNGIADLKSCVEMAMSAWLRSDLDENADPTVTEMLLRFLTEAQAKLASTQAPPAPPGPPGAGGAAPVVGQAPAPAPAPLAPAGAGPISAAA